MARSPFRGGEAEVHRHTARLRSTRRLMYSLACKKVCTPRRRQHTHAHTHAHAHSGGFDVHCHVRCVGGGEKKKKRGALAAPETPRGERGAGTQAGAGEWAAESPASEQTATSSRVQVKCAPLVTSAKSPRGGTRTGRADAVDWRQTAARYPRA